MSKSDKPQVCKTVASLITLLKTLPPTLKFRQGFGRGVVPTHFNRGDSTEHLSFEENDGTWTEKK